MMQTMLFTFLCFLPLTASQNLFDVDDQSSGSAVAKLLQIFRDYKILEKSPLPVLVDRIGNLTQRLRGEQAELTKLAHAECSGPAIDCHCADMTVKYGDKVIAFGLSYLVDRMYRQLSKSKQELARMCLKHDRYYELYCASGVYTMLPGLQRDMTQLVVDSCREFLASRLTYLLTGCGRPDPARPPLYEPPFGGRPAYPHALPWNVEIVKRDGSHWCGGFLVTHSALVTAAHCVRGQEGLTLVVGGTTVNDQDPGVQRREKLRALLHPHADIAIVKFDEAVRINEFTKLLCLPAEYEQRNREPGTVLQMAGYGSTGVEHPNDLRQVGAMVTSDFECGKAYPKEANKRLVFCAGNSTDSCWGDSGNAAFAKRGDDVYVAYGVLSYGNGCTQPGHPGVYVKISAVLEWLKSNLVADD